MPNRSRIPEAMAAIREMLEDAVAEFNPDQQPGYKVSVYDGPFVTGSTRDAIHVGYDGDPGGEYDSASSSSTWAGIGAKRRNEAITIVCAVMVETGATDVAKARERAFELLAIAEETLRADPSLGLNPPTVAEVNSAQLYSHPLPENGLLTRIPFTVSIDTRN